MIGREFSHYKILDKLGEGGMGVVYRALDTSLDRQVAIKVLPPGAIADAERKNRFVQEAKTASALNHPNIVTIHEIGSVDGADFIAMEYVQGRTLDRIIGHKGIELVAVLPYSVQIADALASAHAAGIVHRDIKPANIIVTDKGLVKVLDFGLAKLTQPAESGDAGPTQSTRLDRSPRTEEGTIVGTVAYMSPEQAEGKKVDARSDIFSFGSVLYEMVTGRRAFQGDTKMSTLTAILREEPKPVSDVTELVPRELERIITRCLRKDPQRRFQHVDDLKVALAELQEESASGKLLVGFPPQTMLKRRWRPSAVALGGAGLVLAAVAVTWWAMRAEPPARELTLTRLTSDPGLTQHGVLSVDGKLLAYASDRGGEGNLDIWVQQVGGGAAIRLTRDGTDDSEPAFSPDGTRIVFRSERAGGGIYSVSTLGGEPVRMADRGRNPHFSPDGTSIAYWIGDRSVFGRRTMYVLPSGGGQAQAIQPDFHSASLPVWSPDGTRLLFLGAPDLPGNDARGFDWWVTPLAGNRTTAIRTGAFDLFLQRRLFPRQQDPAAWVGDRILFSAGLGDLGGLWEVPISARTSQASGPARRLTSGAGLEVQPSAAASGALVFTSLTGNPDVWSVSLSEDGEKVRGDIQRLTTSGGSDVQPAASADGKTVVFLSDRSGTVDVWSIELESGREVPLTNTAFEESAVRISSNGAQVAYVAFEGEKTRIYEVPSRGGMAVRLCDNCPGAFYYWSLDGARLVYKPMGSATTHLVLRDVRSGTEQILLKHPKYGVTAASLSPDEQWMSFQTIISPLQRQLFVAPVRNWSPAPETHWIPVTDGSGLDRNATWSPDGNLLYFLSERDEFRCIWAQRLEPLTKRPTGAAVPVLHFHQARRSPMWFQEVSNVGLSVAQGRLFFSMPEYTGNVWLAKLEAAAR